jgi:uncharacterized membrane protein (UPF0127 family)
LGTRSLEAGEGLILPGCRMIHTWGMRYAIDVLFLDGAGTLMRVWPALPPWRVTPLVWRARTALELPAGTIQRLQVACGSRIWLQPALQTGGAARA